MNLQGGIILSEGAFAWNSSESIWPSRYSALQSSGMRAVVRWEVQVIFLKTMPDAFVGSEINLDSNSNGHPLNPLPSQDTLGFTLLSVAEIPSSKGNPPEDHRRQLERIFF